MSSFIPRFKQWFKPVQRSSPLAMHCLAIGLLILSAWGWLRFQQSLFERGWMTIIGVQVNPLYTTLTGAVWGLAGLISALGLWLRQRWAVIATAVTTGGFLLWYWLDRWLLWRSAGPNLIFSLVVSLLGLAYTAVVLIDLNHYSS
jgi:hypothetical protein